MKRFLSTLMVLVLGWSMNGVILAESGNLPKQPIKEANRLLRQAAENSDVSEKIAILEKVTTLFRFGIEKSEGNRKTTLEGLLGKLQIRISILKKSGLNAEKLIKEVGEVGTQDDLGVDAAEAAIKRLEEIKKTLNDASSELSNCREEKLADRCQESAKEAGEKADRLREKLSIQNINGTRCVLSTNDKCFDPDYLPAVPIEAKESDRQDETVGIDALDKHCEKLQFPCCIDGEDNSTNFKVQNDLGSISKAVEEDRMVVSTKDGIRVQGDSISYCILTSLNQLKNPVCLKGGNSTGFEVPNLEVEESCVSGLDAPERNLIQDATVTDQNATQNFTTAEGNNTQNVTIADQHGIADNAIKLAEEKIKEELIPLLTEAVKIHSQIASESISYFFTGICPMLQHRINWSQFKIIKENLRKNNIWYREVYRSQYLVDTVDLLEKLLVGEELGATFFKDLVEYVRKSAESSKPILPAVQFLLNQGYDNNITQVNPSADELEFMNLTKDDFSARSDLMNAIIKVAKGFNRGCFYPIDDESLLLKKMCKSVSGYALGFAFGSNIYKQYLRRAVHGFIYSCYDAVPKFENDDIKVLEVWKSIEDVLVDADNKVGKSAEEVLDFINKAIDEAKRAEVVFAQYNNEELTKLYAMKAEQLRVLSTVIASVNNVGICSILNQGDRLDLLEGAHDIISAYYAGGLFFKGLRLSVYVGGAIILGVSLPNVLGYLSGVNVEGQVRRDLYGLRMKNTLDRIN